MIGADLGGREPELLLDPAPGDEGLAPHVDDRGSSQHGSGCRPVYELEDPVRFEGSSNAGQWTDITKCYVMMPDQKWIGIDVIDIRRHEVGMRVKATLTNTSPSRWVIAYWFTHSDDPGNEYYSPRRGMFLLGRRPRTFEFDYLWTNEPRDPVIQLGAAVITNPAWHDPSKGGGVGTLAIDANRRMAYLGRGS